MLVFRQVCQKSDKGGLSPKWLEKNPSKWLGIRSPVPNLVFLQKVMSLVGQKYWPKLGHYRWPLTTDLG